MRLVLQNILPEKLLQSLNEVLQSHEALDDESFNDDQIYKERLNEVNLGTNLNSRCCSAGMFPHPHRTCLQIEFYSAHQLQLKQAYYWNLQVMTHYL